MDLFNNIGKTVASAAKTVTRRSEDMVELTKLNLTIGNEEDKVKKILYEIGSELYRGYTNGSSNEVSYDRQCNEVKQIEDNLKILKERVLMLKGSKTCRSCKTVVDLSVNYCPNCGEKLEREERERNDE